MLSGKILRLLKRTGWILCLLTAFVLGIKQLREPDVWWMLRTGQWILQHGKIMKQDVFSYTFEGTEWLNVKWGFEVILLWLSRIGGPEITLLLQSVANVLLLWFVYKVYNIFRKTDEPQKKRYLPGFNIIICAYLLLLTCEFRFNGRPEMVSHVMTAVYLFVLLSWRFFPSHFIFILIPLQILWVNLHEAYGTGMVMMLAMLGATWFEHLFIFKNQNTFGNRPKPENPLNLTIAVFLAITATAIHPWGLRMISHPLEIFSQVQENKFTTELLSFTENEYWKKEAYINVLIFLFGLFSFFFRFSLPEAAPKNKIKKTKIKWYLPPVSRFSFGYIVLYFLFFYLSLSAYRNIPFFIIASIPLVAIGLDNIFKYFSWKWETKGKQKSSIIKGKAFAYLGLIVLGIATYIFIVSGGFYKTLDDGRDQYGLKVNPVMNPVGAAYFIADNNINGRCFSDFLVSNYLLWQLRPDFKTFIDLRDLDVFPADFFNQFANILYQPQKLEEFDKKYNFSYAVLTRNNFQALHKYLANNPNWVPAYADPVAAIYLKRTPENNGVITRLGIDSVRKDIFKEPMEWANSRLATNISKIFRPGYDPVKHEPVNYDLIATEYYKSIENFDLALAHAKKASQNTTDGWKGDIETGNILYQTSTNDTTAANRLVVNQAIESFNTAIAKNKEAENAYLGLGVIKMDQQDWQAATENFNSALKINDKNINAYIYLAQIQNYLMQAYPDLSSAYLKARVNYLEKAYKLDKSNYYIRFHLGIANCQLPQCDKCKEYLDEIINFPGVSEEDRKYAKQLLMQCGGSE